MGCCLSICGKDSEPASHAEYQLSPANSAEASPAASAVLPQENDRESLYPNPLFAHGQKLGINYSREQPIPANSVQAIAWQPIAAIRPDTLDPVDPMIASTYNGSLKNVRGDHYQSYSHKDRAQYHPRRPMAPMTESLRQRESRDLAASTKVKGNASALREGAPAHQSILCKVKIQKPCGALGRIDFTLDIMGAP